MNRKQIGVSLTESEHLMYQTMSDILDEGMSEIIRRLMKAEARRCAAFLEGEELGLWVDLLRTVDYENDMLNFKKKQKLSESRREAYRKKNGEELSPVEEYKMDSRRDYHREYQRNRRKVARMEQVKKIKEKYGIVSVSAEDL